MTFGTWSLYLSFNRKMKAFIAVLILISFLQTTILSMDLVAAILMYRAFLGGQKNNLYLSFGFGLLVSHLSGVNLGVYSLYYVLLAELAMIFAKTPFFTHRIASFTLILISSILSRVSLGLIFSSTIVWWPNFLYEIAIFIPIFILIKFWEERFVIKSYYASR